MSCKQFQKGSLEDLTLKILQRTAGGQVSKNAAVMGIILQCLDAVDRESRGISTLKSRRAMDDLERDMLQEAASLLASNGCSAELMKKLGFSKESTLRSHGKLVHLLQQGLPSPCLSLLFPGVLEPNMALIDSIVPRQSARRKRFAVCVDSTYLLPIQCCLQIHDQRAVVGGPFRMSDLKGDAPGSFQRVANGVEITEPLKQPPFGMMNP